MTATYFILAMVMALFGVLGYLYGTRSAILTFVLALFSLIFVNLFGSTIVTFINRVWQLFWAGGITVLTGSGDLAGLKAKMDTIPPLIPSDSAGAFIMLIFIVLLLLIILLGRHPRFRRPPSGLGLLIGLFNGYMVGSYLLVSIVPALAGILWVPFGLGPKVTTQPAAAAAATPQGIDLGAQLTQLINAASPRALTIAAMFIIGGIILIALLANLSNRPRRGPGPGR